MINGLINLIDTAHHHADSKKFEMNSRFVGIRAVKARAEMIETELKFAYQAINKILKITKKNNGEGYEQIKNILENEQYNCE